MPITPSPNPLPLKGARAFPAIENEAQDLTKKADSRTPTPRAAVLRGCRDAFGLPVVAVAGGMAGFGSLARDSGLGLGAAVVASAGVYGLPGQVAFAELYASGAELFAVILAVSMGNVRFFPMAVAFMPLLRVDLRRPASLFALVQLLSVTSWAAAMRAFPDVPAPFRRHYFAAFGLVCLVAGVAGTVAGHVATGALPRPVALGLIFLNPLFIGLLLADTRATMTILALIAGAVAGPVFHLVSADWGVLAAGLVAGSAVFLFTEARSRRARRP